MPTMTRRSRAEKRSHTATTGGVDSAALPLPSVNKAARLSLDHTQANPRSALKDISNQRPHFVNGKDTRGVSKIETIKVSSVSPTTGLSYINHRIILTLPVSHLPFFLFCALVLHPGLLTVKPGDSGWQGEQPRSAAFR
jgi:hypothetical protein